MQDLKVEYRPATFPLVLFLIASALNAQVTSSISGYIKDSSGAVIPEATVTAVSTEQGLTRTTHSDHNGYYELVAIPAATYNITFEARGFQRQLQTNVELQVNQSLRLDGLLTVGEVQAEVTVTSSATLVNTANSTLSDLVDDRRVQDLPLNGRNIMSLTEILPGVTDISAPETMANTRGGPTMAVNGSRNRDNNFTFNGANWTNFSQSSGMNYPPPDAIAEVQIQTQQFDSQYGEEVGSQVVVTSKSGTNAIHGSAWEFLRNTDLNARSFFQTVRPVDIENQFGAAAGGPIKKNKLFAFGYYEGLRVRPQAGSTVSFVPTAAERDGDFTAVSTKLKDPLDALTGQPLTGSSGQPCVSGNIIAPACLNPAAQTYMNKWVPQSPNGQVVALAPVPANNYSYMGRIDYLQSAKSSFNGHFFVENYTATFANGTIQPYETGARLSENKDFAVSNTYTFTPALLNQVTVDFMHADSSDRPVTQTPPLQLGVNIPYGDGEGLSITVNGYFSLLAANPAVQDYRNPHLRDAMTWIHGRHTLKWGYEASRLSFRLDSNFNTNTAKFSGAYSGNALVDFELGVFDTINVNYGSAEANYVEYKHDFFLQDEFKISPRLTLTLGTRWEPYFAPKQKYGDYTVNDLANLKTVSATHPDAIPGTLFVGDPGTPQNGKLQYNDMNNFGPRVGFAWDVFGDGKTSIRGGYGLFYDQMSLNVAHQPQAPYAGTSILNDGNFSNPYGSLNTPFPPSNTSSGSFGCVKISAFPGYKCAFPLPANEVMTNEHLVVPYTHSMSLTIDRQVGHDMRVQLSYAGKLTKKLEGHEYWDYAVTEPDPLTGAAPSVQNENDRVFYPDSIGLYGPQNRILGNYFQAAYHSVQARVDKHFSHGLSFLASYVFSKELDNYVGGGAGLINDDPADMRIDKGRGQYDHTHVFSASWLWRQEHKFTNSFVNHLLADWGIGAYHTAQSGEPINFAPGTDIALNGAGNTSVQHADLEPNMTYANVGISHPNTNAFVTKFFNTAAFVPQSQMKLGTYGNAGRDFMNGPALFNTDVTLTREFPIRERLRVQFRSEFFNLFNEKHFLAPNTTIGSGSFGQITGANPGRVVQIAAKLTW